jgi:putative oxidoreductase
MATPVSEQLAGNEADRRSLLEVSPSATRQPPVSLVRGFVGGTGRIETLERYGPLAARLLMSQIFIISGIMKVIDPSGTAAQMEGRGMFWVPLFLVGAIAFELGGGLSLLAGYKARLGALALFLFLIPVTLTFHNWWTYPDPKEQHVNMLFLLHNLTLMGGLILLMTFGPGPFSIDHKARRPA